TSPLLVIPSGADRGGGKFGFLGFARDDKRGKSPPAAFTRLDFSFPRVVSNFPRNAASLFLPRYPSRGIGAGTRSLRGESGRIFSRLALAKYWDIRRARPANGGRHRRRAHS